MYRYPFFSKTSYILITILLVSCSEAPYVPKELEAPFVYLDTHLNEKELSILKSNTEKKYPPYYHNLNIQDSLTSLLASKKPEWHQINHFFDSLQIKRDGDKTGILLNMYQDYLHEVDISVEQELEIITKYWSPIKSCKKLMEINALTYSKKYNKGDKIQILMPVDEHDNAIDYPCPTLEWTFKTESDLELHAIIEDRYNQNHVNGLSFKVKLFYKNSEYTTIQSQEVFTGDELIIPLKTAWKINAFQQ